MVGYCLKTSTKATNPSQVKYTELTYQENKLDAERVIFSFHV